MADVHLTRELLDAVFRGEKNSGDIVPVVLGHLFDVCPQCRHAFAGWREGFPASTGHDYEDVAENAVDHATRALKHIREQQKAAQGFLRELLAQPPQDRIKTLKQVPHEKKGPALANSLIEASREAMPGNPRESLSLAQLARTVVQHAELSPFVCEVYARAVAYVGNALRALGSLPEAAEILTHARFILRQQGGGDRLSRSELDRLEGSIRLHQRDYPAAEALFKRAEMGYRFAGLGRDALLCKMNLAMVYDYDDRLALCLETQRGVVENLESAEDPRLLWIARHNLAKFLSDTKEYEEATRVLERNKELLQSGDTLSELRINWIEGSIAQGRKDLAAAEAYFSMARYGFQKFSLPFDTALVSLDLAGVYLEQGQIQKVAQLAEELVGVFQKQQRHQETLAALMLFQQAAEVQRVTRNLVRNLAIYLRRSALDPGYVFIDTTVV